MELKLRVGGDGTWAYPMRYSREQLIEMQKRLLEQRAERLRELEQGYR